MSSLKFNQKCLSTAAVLLHTPHIIDFGDFGNTVSMCYFAEAAVSASPSGDRPFMESETGGTDAKPKAASSTSSNDVHFFKPDYHDSVQYSVNLYEGFPHKDKSFKEIFDNIDNRFFCYDELDKFEKNDCKNFGRVQEFQMYCYQKFRLGEFKMNFGQFKSETHFSIYEKLRNDDGEVKKYFDWLNQTIKLESKKCRELQKFEKYCNFRKSDQMRKDKLVDFDSDPLKFSETEYEGTDSEGSLQGKTFSTIFEENRKFCWDELKLFNHPYEMISKDINRLNFQRYCDAKFQIGDFICEFGKHRGSSYRQLFRTQSGNTPKVDNYIKWCRDQKPELGNDMRCLVDFCDQAQERLDNGDFLMQTEPDDTSKFGDNIKSSTSHREVFQKWLQGDEGIVAYVTDIRKKKNDNALSDAEKFFMEFFENVEERFKTGKFLLNYGSFYPTKSHKWLTKHVKGYVKWCQGCETPCEEMKFFLKYVEVGLDIA